MGRASSPAPKGRGLIPGQGTWMWCNWILMHCWWQRNVVGVRPLWKTGWWFLTKLNIFLHNPAVVLPAASPKDWKTYVHTETCLQMFAKQLHPEPARCASNQGVCSSGGEWLNKLFGIVCTERVSFPLFMYYLVIYNWIFILYFGI